MPDHEPQKPSQPPLVIDQIKRQIRARIGTSWRIGDRLPPITDLARELGMGEKNTYRAVRALAEEGLLASRPRHGTFVADRPRKAARTQRKRHVIHVPLGPDRDGMIQRMGRAFVEELQRRGREVRLDGDVPNNKNAIDLSAIDADAIALFNVNIAEIRSAQPGPMFALMDTSGRVPPGITRRYDMVGPDNEQGGLIAGECLRDFGFDDAAFVGVEDKFNPGQYASLDATRLDGFERGFGHALDDDRRFFVSNYSQPVGATFAREYAALRRRPEALFFATDEIAAGFIIGALALGLKHRRDYHLIGFDGQSHVMPAVSGGITTVAVPAEAMGRQAAEFLDMRLEHPDLPPRSISLGCTIKRGKTTPKPAKPTDPFWGDRIDWPAPSEKGKST